MPAEQNNATANNFPQLNSPLTIGNMTLKNRMVMSPMTRCIFAMWLNPCAFHQVAYYKLDQKAEDADCKDSHHDFGQR